MSQAMYLHVTSTLVCSATFSRNRHTLCCLKFQLLHGATSFLADTIAIAWATMPHLVIWNVLIWRGTVYGKLSYSIRLRNKLNVCCINKKNYVIQLYNRSAQWNSYGHASPFGEMVYWRIRKLAVTAVGEQFLMLGVWWWSMPPNEGCFLLQGFSVPTYM